MTMAVGDEVHFTHNQSEYALTSYDNGTGEVTFILSELKDRQWHDLSVDFTGKGTADELTDRVIDMARKWLQARDGGTLWVWIQKR